ncbi:unnamed protein product [Didymodactylos carnosus]|uniref:Uncharacterized protein n=1 Tax=Didymodactylos carnosus TaxID=1234261 RepID=A0A814JUG5_9BILA|nr:unnamed protein product [Didymodactylos carnosus]CAF3812860.1 unnamed protein product [Didymodactylos carnosus]
MVARNETVNRSSSTSSAAAEAVTGGGEAKEETGTDDMDEGEDGMISGTGMGERGSGSIPSICIAWKSRMGAASASAAQKTSYGSCSQNLSDRPARESTQSSEVDTRGLSVGKEETGASWTISASVEGSFEHRAKAQLLREE